MRKSYLKYPIALLLVCFLASGSALASASVPKESKTYDAAIDFRLETVAGKIVSLSDSKGKPVILFFFTTWCPYCRQKFPGLSKEYPVLRQEGIDLLAIDSGESQAKVSSFVAKERPSFDILLDKTTQTAGAYGVVGVPTFVLISKSGSIIYEGNDLPDNYKELLSN